MWEAPLEEKSGSGIFSMQQWDLAVVNVPPQAGHPACPQDVSVSPGTSGDGVMPPGDGRDQPCSHFAEENLISLSEFSPEFLECIYV